MTHVYPPSSVWSDYLRAVAGVALTGGPVLLIDELPTTSLTVLAGLAMLFLGFAVQTARRQRSVVETSDERIANVPRGALLRWDALTDERLANYSTRRDAERGWMQLTLREGRKRIHVDSRLDGFTEVVRRAAGAARRNRLTLRPSTLSNLSALGIDVPQSGPDGSAVTT